jgi:DNA-binding Lrp family transcriptional regulator
MEKTLAVVNKLEQEGIIRRYTIYPDISAIFSAKAQRRQTLAVLSWEEKAAIVEQMAGSRTKKQ